MEMQERIIERQNFLVVQKLCSIVKYVRNVNEYNLI